MNTDRIVFHNEEERQEALASIERNTAPTSTTETIWVPATDGPKGSETLQPPQNVRNAIVKHFGDLGAKRVQQAHILHRSELNKHRASLHPLIRLAHTTTSLHQHTKKM